MLQIFQESGIGGWIVLIFTIAGLAAVTTVGRRWGRPGSVAAAWAVAILAAGSIGFGFGQRSVNRGMRGVAGDGSGQMNAPPPERMVAMLSRGTAEAAGNYVLAGNGALLVLLVGGLLVFFRKKDGSPTPASAVKVGT
jgi:hypothetical protein